MQGIKKIIKELDENGNEIEIEITEYPDIPVIVVNSDGEEIIESNVKDDLSKEESNEEDIKEESDTLEENRLDDTNLDDINSFLDNEEISDESN